MRTWPPGSDCAYADARVLRAHRSHEAPSPSDISHGKHVRAVTAIDVERSSSPSVQSRRRQLDHAGRDLAPSKPIVTGGRRRTAADGRRQKRTSGEGRSSPGACFLGEQQSRALATARSLVTFVASCETDVINGRETCVRVGAARGASAGVVSPCARKRQRRGPAKAVVGVLADPPILVFSLSIGKGLMTISMPDRFRLAAPRGRRRRVGMAMWLLEQSRLASCPRPGRTKSTPLTRRRIAVWRLKRPPRVARARRDGRDGSCANGRPRDVGHRCERWRALERERSAAF